MVQEPALLDRCLKVLPRHAYPAIFRLFGAEIDPATVRFEDVALNVPEHRADDLLVVEASEPAERWALLLEVQTRPEPDLLRSWRYKVAAAEKVLECPVVLAVLYLERGSYATFPSREVIRGGPLQNVYEFVAVQLWEHAERISNGDLPQLAPLLLLAAAEKTEAVLEQERRLILDLPISSEQQRDLLAVATMVGTRYFSHETLRRIFREEMAMLKDAGFIQDWINEGEARGRAAGQEQGRAAGRAEGEMQGVRTALLRLLRARFGALTPDLEARLSELTVEQALELQDRAAVATSLAELGF